MLSKALSYSGVFDLIKLFKHKQLIIFNYHRIYDKFLETKFDERVFGLSIQEFEKQVKFLKKHTTILSEDELIHQVETRKPFGKPCSMITFDDGYIDNYELAYPILKELNVPATFFIPTEAIEKRYVGWWDLIAYFIKSTNKKTIEVDGKRIKFQTDQEKKVIIDELLKFVKTVEESKSIQLIDSLSEQCEVPFPSHEDKSSQIMTWDQIREVHANNISIGSHSHTHRVLKTIDEKEQLKELEESKKILENELNAPINSISYPVGGYDAFTKKTRELAKQVGYKVAYSFGTGFNVYKITDPFDVKRIWPDNDFNIFKGMVLLPSVFAEYGLKKLKDE